MKYRIWSNEHQAYWKPNRHGYTLGKDLAGEYSQDEAIAICHNANQYQQPFENPNETMVPIIL